MSIVKNIIRFELRCFTCKRGHTFIPLFHVDKTPEEVKTFFDYLKALKELNIKAHKHLSHNVDINVYKIPRAISIYNGSDLYKNTKNILS